MGPGLRLEITHTQQLVMTPQLQQAIRLLQLTNLELQSFLEGECERNPLLSLDDAAAGPAEPPERSESREGATPLANGDAPEIAGFGAENLHDTGAGEGPGSTPAHLRGRVGAPGGGSDGLDRGLEERLAEPPTLRAHLLAQIGQMAAATQDRMLARLLVESLDEHGYLRGDLAAMARELGVGGDALERAVGLVQACEPTGVGARSLAECLALQLAERDRLDPAMQALVGNLGLLGRGEHDRLRKLCGIDAEDYSDMLAELRALDPRPCAGFAAAEATTVVPDVLVRRAGWGGWTVELNADTLPRVLVDNHYAAALEKGGGDARRFVAECRASAGWLMRALDQRARTLLSVATEIVRHQERFFEEGIAGLRPLTLKALAETAGVHESTASRVTAGKYIGTERGVLEMRFFFTNAVGGGDMAASSVRHRIRALVDAEAPDAVLSDDDIVDLLEREGIALARRTVAKYRKTLHIPSSVERRRQKAARAVC